MATLCTSVMDADSMKMVGIFVHMRVGLLNLLIKRVHLVFHNSNLLLGGIYVLVKHLNKRVQLLLVRNRLLIKGLEGLGIL
jgi:hypothetical protein